MHTHPSLPNVTPPTATFSRRDFLATTAGLAAGAALQGLPLPSPAAEGAPANPIPRWRGFNLTNFFQAFSRGEEGQGMVREDDLRWIRDWGFDFVRLPMDYWLWVDSDWRQTRNLRPDDVLKINEATLEKVDRAVELSRKYKLHLSLNFHRAPGYCINNPEREPFVLWTDKRAEDAFVHHWELFAKRYQGEPKEAVSFNLVNEAPNPREGYMTRADYARVMTRATEAIRKHAPNHVVIVDGLNVGNSVVTELVPLGVAQSVHAYWPGGISHYRASWVDRKSTFPMPTWPLKNKDGSIQADRTKLEERFAPWGELARQGIGVHCGECGCYNKTPYEVFMGWFSDVMDVLKSHSIGYALWNFRGSFGILDSGRADIEYEDWQGHKLDRRLLTLLQRY
jgi:aryl-phospho-beta-D-glucosidase BglC (GH1 family)